tara:strand:- start:1069 stop:1278 length:210 start_codon:yes stop_codon:yes gene_type:complete
VLAFDYACRHILGSISHNPSFNYLALTKNKPMQTKTKKDWTQTLFVGNIATVTFIVGVIVGQFVKVIIM